jgi:MFS transporter, Spinster family, sphingosine-1-phosphate transporter
MVGTPVRGIRQPKVVLALFTALNLLNYLDRTVLSSVLGPVQDDLHLSNLLAGWLSTIFLIGYFATCPVFGVLGDRVGQGGRSKLIALGIAIWSLATVASGLATGKASMIAARAFVGIGEASYATIAPTLIDDMAPPAQQSRWMSIFYSATPIGSALGYLVGGAIYRWHGWRAAFLVAGGPGLAVALLCLLIVEPPRPTSAVRSRQDIPPAATKQPASASSPEGMLDAARVLFRVPLYAGNVLGYCAYTFALGGFAFWAPAYLYRQYAIDAGKASIVFGLVTVAGGSIGTLVGGSLADRAARARVRQAETAKGGALDPREMDDAVARGNVFIPALGTAMAVPLSALAIASATAARFFIAVLPAEIALFLLSGPINVALLRASPPELRARGMALSIFAIHALGDLWSPLLIGVAADHVPMQLAMFTGPAFFALAAYLWFWTARASARLT